jgi:hypothetical protein
MTRVALLGLALGLAPGLALVTAFGIAGAAACSHRGLPAPDPDGNPAVGPGAVIDALTDDGVAQRFRIDTVTPDPRDRDGDVWLYGVSVLDPASGQWRPYCMPDIEGRRAAIPIQGSWRSDAAFQPGSDQPAANRVTFACTSGAIGKCVRFGYKPWKTHDGVALAPYHAACVRMVRADYCGDGRPHTVDGTRIDVWDHLGIQRRDQPADHPEVFEAAWSPTGAAYLHVPRWSDDVDDIIKDCPAHFAGRTSADGPLDPDQATRRFPEALVFDARFLRAADRKYTPPSP